MPDHAPMRFAVALNGGRIEVWQRDAVKRLAQCGIGNPVAFISDAATRPLPRIYWTASRRMVDARAEFPHAQFLSAPAHTHLAGGELDFVLDFRSPASTAAPLPAARHGTWRFRFGDPDRHPGDPPCLSEFFARDAVTIVTLVRTTDANDRRVPLKRGCLPVVAGSYERSVEGVLSEVFRWPEYVCRDLRSGIGSYVDGPGIAMAPERPANFGVATTMRFLGRSAGGRIDRRFRRWFIEDRWNIGVVDAPISRFLAAVELDQVHWFPQTGKLRFLADPFGVATGPTPTVFCEWYDASNGRGRILAFDFDRSGWNTTPTEPFDVPVHVSYPFLIADGDKVFCIPETGQAGEIALYEVGTSPVRCVKKGALLGGTAGVDTTIVRRDGRWWLFTGLMDDGPMYKLHVWYADELTGPWLPHAGNPVKIDIRSARGAGTPFVHEAALYRPAQDCSGSYGKAVIINRILELTPTAFREERAATVLPYSRGPYPFGVHTLSSFGERTLVDGKYRRITGRGLRNELSRAFRKVARIGRQAVASRP